MGCCCKSIFLYFGNEKIKTIAYRDDVVTYIVMRNVSGHLEIPSNLDEDCGFGVNPNNAIDQNIMVISANNME